MSKKEKNYKISKNLLQNYQENALQNAQDLLDEAQLLLNHKRYARAYFLACSSMEETGKACLAWSAQGRNPNNEGWHKILKDRFELHPIKLSYAFYCWFIISPNQIKTLIKFPSYLLNGREKSMYVDINTDNFISMPSKVVKPKAANDCVDIASKCLIATKYYIANNNPPNHSSVDDKLFCIRDKNIKSMLKEEDVGDYLIDHIKNAKDWISCIVTYHDNFYCKNKRYKNSDSLSLKKC